MRKLYTTASYPGQLPELNDFPDAPLGAQTATGYTHASQWNQPAPKISQPKPQSYGVNTSRPWALQAPVTGMQRMFEVFQNDFDTGAKKPSVREGFGAFFSGIGDVMQNSRRLGLADDTSNESPYGEIARRLYQKDM
jgi:hypothetical protein